MQDSLSDAGAADNFTVQCNSRLPVGGETQRPAEVLQQANISSAVVAKNEIGADRDAPYLAKVLRQRTDKLLTTQALSK